MVGQIDTAVLEFFQRLHTPVLDKLMILFTNLGEYGFIWIFIGIILFMNPGIYGRKQKTEKQCSHTFLSGSRMTGIMVLSALLIGLIVGNGILKNVIARPRPCWRITDIPMLIQIPNDYSFPSGHTLAAFEAVSVLLLRKEKIAVPALVLGILIACSRMYLFVHYPTDILAGLILGLIIGCSTVWVYQKMWKEKANEAV